MYYVLDEISGTEISVESVADVSASNTESVTSTGGVDTESLTVSEVQQSKEWPEGSVDSFTNYALPSLLFGMLGIFLVLGLIAIATMALNKFFPNKNNND